MSKAQGIIISLENECEKDWEEGQKRLQQVSDAAHEVVQRSFQSMWQSGYQCYEAQRKELSERRSRIDRLLLDRNCQLSPEESLLCEGGAAGPVFQVIVGDCRLSIAQTLASSFHLLAWDLKAESQKDWGLKLQQFCGEQAEKNQTDVAAQAAESAKRLGVGTPDYQAAALRQGEATQRGLRELCASPAEREALDCLKEGLESGREGRFDEALGKLQRGWELLKDGDDLDLFLQLSTGLAETYCQAARLQDCVSLCQLTLTTWGRSPHHFQLLRTLFYLTQALYWLELYDQGYAVVEEWSAKLVADNAPSKCVLLCTQANKLRIQNKSEEAEELLEGALQGSSTSYITICSRRYLA
ncbi:MAG: hypothetical protein J0651_00405, partial [Actinobacteria bacterium]|nr:hypothetical protein [Actinomycetota bacterium]